MIEATARCGRGEDEEGGCLVKSVLTKLPMNEK